MCPFSELRASEAVASHRFGSRSTCFATISFPQADARKPCNHSWAARLPTWLAQPCHLPVQHSDLRAVQASPRRRRRVVVVGSSSRRVVVVVASSSSPRRPHHDRYPHPSSWVRSQGLEAVTTVGWDAAAGWRAAGTVRAVVAAAPCLHLVIASPHRRRSLWGGCRPQASFRDIGQNSVLRRSVDFKAFEVPGRTIFGAQKCLQRASKRL